jgi:hypothetical protein
MLLGGQNVHGTKLSPVNPAIALAMTFIFAKNSSHSSSFTIYRPLSCEIY